MGLENTYVEIASILALALILGIVGHFLRQPLVIMFLVTGILAGPSVFGIIHSYQQVELLAHIGVALLLFIVGLRLDLNLIRTIGPVALATGLGQIVFTSIIGFLIALALGMSYLTAAYVSVALTFSSTIIIVKLLSDKKEIDSLHGQIAIGFLIVQDIAAILALIGLTSFAQAGAAQRSAIITAVVIIGKGVALFGVVGVLMRFALPQITRRLAQSLEVLTLFAITWAVILGAVSDLLGFSKEVGAFLAGVSLASTDYRDSIGARLTSLRDFLLLFFFIDLGARLDWSSVGSQIGASLIFSLFVLIGNPLIVLMIMGLMGYRRRTGFLAGLTVAQISEFSLIIVALGLTIGHLTNETVGLVTLVGIVTIFASTYLILYSGPLYRLLAGPLKIFEKRNPFRETAINTIKEQQVFDVVLVGLGNYGSALAEHLKRRNKTFLAVDFDPAVLDRWRQQGVPVIYGDMGDPDMHKHLPLSKTRWVISTVRSRDMNLALVSHLRDTGYAGKIALTATNQAEADEFRRAGAHLVFRPFKDATEQAADALMSAIDYLPQRVDLPASFAEVRIRTDAAVVGKAIRDIPLSARGMSIVAISRGGRLFYDPDPDFRIFPADRLLLMGPSDQLKEADDLLNQLEVPISDDADRFEIAEITVGDDSKIAGKSLADLRFRQTYGVTVVAIHRKKELITAISPGINLVGGDRLVVIGKAETVKGLLEKGQL